MQVPELQTQRTLTTLPGRRLAASGNPPPPPSALLFRVFSGYARGYVRRHFHSMRMAGTPPELPSHGAPVLVYLNHAAWWDPLTCLLLARQFFGARSHYAPIDARALVRYGFFRKLGFFGVEQGTRRGAARFLRAGSAVLARSDAVLWVTAEGEFRDPRQRPVQLRPGVAHLLRHMTAGVVLPLAVEYTFWQERTPELLVRFGDALDASTFAGLSVAERQDRLTAALERTMDRLAADSIRRNPAAFTTLLGGRAGIGGVYDVWRRAKAFVRREHFTPEHGARP